MNGSDVMEVLDRLRSADVRFWVDGGWGVDALLGGQTREHEDLDLVVEREVCERAATVLRALGLAHDAEEQPGLPARFVLRDARGRRVDLHPVVFGPDGNAWQPLPGGAWGAYPDDGLQGTGEIEDQPVPCITVDLQLRHHLSYGWDENDRHDMELLAERFGVALPPQ
jgi:lincosamide nucleotidyltransferase A/C/D/E